MAGTFAHGATLSIFATSSSTEGTALANLTNIGGPNMTADSIDVSAHSTSSTYYREFVQGLKDAGEVSLEGNYTKATSTAMVAAFEASKRHFKIALPTTSSDTWSFNGFFTAYNTLDAPFEDKISFSASIKVTGKPALT